MKFFKSIVSLLMIVVLLFSSMGFSVNRHYCMGIMVEENFYVVSDHCGLNKDSHCEKPSGTHVERNCCDDEIISLPGIEVKKLNETDGLQLIPDWQPRLLLSVLFKPFFTDNKGPHSVPLFIPPPKKRDILIDVQRFLI